MNLPQKKSSITCTGNTALKSENGMEPMALEIDLTAGRHGMCPPGIL